jgi:GNAT superfamily N-acetyltransferase
MIDINQTILSEDIKEFILDGFNEHTTSVIGYDGFVRDQVAFTAYDEGRLIGAISMMSYYGALWIKLFFVDKDYRKTGIGKQLLEKALDYGREQGHKFAFLETLSFQALEFYKKFGFELEFTRQGYKDGISFHYLRKNL